MVCEGFQFILKNQADALLALGVSPQFKVRLLSLLTTKHPIRGLTRVTVLGRRAVSSVEVLPAEKSPGLYPRPCEELQVQSGEFLW